MCNKAPIGISAVFTLVAACLMSASQASQAATPAPAGPASQASAPVAAAATEGPSKQEVTRLRSAPTIAALANAKVLEREAEAKARLAKWIPPDPVAAPPKAPPMAITAPKVTPPPAVRAPERQRRLIAVHGKVGSESIDVERLDGTVSTIKVGGGFDGYRLLSAGPDGARLSTVRGCPSTTAMSPPSGRGVDASASTCRPSSVTLTVKVGGLLL